MPIIPLCVGFKSVVGSDEERIPIRRAGVVIRCAVNSALAALDVIEGTLPCVLLRGGGGDIVKTWARTWVWAQAQNNFAIPCCNRVEELGDLVTITVHMSRLLENMYVLDIEGLQRGAA